MKNKLFNSGEYYDLFYKDKNYKSEADYLVEKFNQYELKGNSILELGCGTGKHAFYLTKYGYNVLGIERSESMIKQALKVDNFECINGDIRNLELGKKFDCVLSLFHVLSYQITNKSLKSVFQTAKKHLKEDGIFLFDFWFAPAVIHQKPQIRRKTINTDINTICRIAEPETLINKNQVNVKYTFYEFNHQTKHFNISSELHKMRFFSIPELEYLANDLGFKVLRSEEFCTAKDPSLDTWGICMILRKYE